MCFPGFREQMGSKPMLHSMTRGIGHAPLKLWLLLRLVCPEGPVCVPATFEQGGCCRAATCIVSCFFHGLLVMGFEVSEALDWQQPWRPGQGAGNLTRFVRWPLEARLSSVLDNWVVSYPHGRVLELVQDECMLLHLLSFVTTLVARCVRLYTASSGLPHAVPAWC